MVTRLDVCVQNKLKSNLTALSAKYLDYAVHFFLGQFPNMEQMFNMVVVAFIELFYFSDQSI